MNVAKLIKLPLLIDVDEMRDLLNAHHHALFCVQKLVPKGEREIAKEQFLSLYADYLNEIKSNVHPKPFIAPALSVTSDAFEILVHGERELIKPILPIVQMQPHNIDASFRSMVFGLESIAWGVQFSYPMLFHEPKTHQVEKVDERFPNTALFDALRKWVRYHTVPTPFLVRGEKINVPIRLGKRCFSWISSHPGLKTKEIEVVC